MSKSKKIRASLGFGKMPDGTVVFGGHAVFNGLSGNLIFEHPWVDLQSISNPKSEISDWSA